MPKFRHCRYQVYGNSEYVNMIYEKIKIETQRLLLLLLLLLGFQIGAALEETSL